MYKKILVPLDGSRPSETILSQAKAMVKDCGSPELVLLTVVEAFREQPYRKDDNWNIKIQKEAVRVAGNYLKVLQEKLRAEGVKADMVVVEGDPAKEIIDYSVNNGIDLVMMNSKGRTANTRTIFGGVTNKIIRHSPVPVLVVPTAMVS